MPEVATGMYDGSSIGLVGSLEVPAGTVVRILIVPDPDYENPRAAEQSPPPPLTDEARRLWESVLVRPDGE